MGHMVTSRWLLEEGVSYQSALRDMREIREADLLIIDTVDVTERGGREWEIGYAQALGKPIVKVGPNRNVFHQFIPRTLKDWDEALCFFAMLAQIGS